MPKMMLKIDETKIKKEEKMFKNSKRFGLAVLLMAVLIFMGFGYLDAKKPVNETWAVTIPYDSYNFYGSPDAELSGDNVNVSVKKYKGGLRAGYYFHITAENDPDAVNYSQVGFQNLSLSQSECEGYCCYFPDSGCSSPIGQSDTCMQAFLENQPHPACDYDEICLIIRVDYDIEDIAPGGSIQSSGWVMIDVRNTFEAFEDDYEDYHSIESSNNVAAMWVSRAETGDAWTIAISDDFIFQETYRLLTNKNRWEYKIPLTATSPFSFVTTWKRGK